MIRRILVALVLLLVLAFVYRAEVVLFVAHLFFVGEDERRIFAYIYLALAGGLVVLDRRRLIYAIGSGPS